jgi:hypothetical protein
MGESPLIHELLEWASRRTRTYEQTMEAWRSSCPRHTTWEDALVEGLIEVIDSDGAKPSEVRLTSTGRARLNEIL